MNVKQLKSKIDKLNKLSKETESLPKIKGFIKTSCESLLNSSESASDAMAGLNNLGPDKMIYTDSISDILADMNNYHNVKDLIKDTLHTWKFIYFDRQGETQEIPFRYHVASYKKLHEKINNILLKRYGIGNLPKVLSLRSEGMPDKNGNSTFYIVVLDKH